eukprot:TRINITY_DN918_c0_g1_i5.p1 TRINITY_DN918_c0_g1~~TRINITY_DN918_c0_g1_i5.p1  ORF type:complete len:254 (-),score=69.18 TRINITY_DN918_c0_g1_i5:270-1031(-)
MDQFVNIRKESISTTREIERVNDYEIHECRSKENPSFPLAMKRYRTEDLHEKSDIAKVMDEMKKLSNLPPIEGLIAYRGAFVDGQHLCLVRDYVEGQTLNQIILGNNFTPTDIKQICLQISRVVQSLHTHQIFNYNLKPMNVIWTAGNKVALCDFAMVELRESLQRKATSSRKADIAVTPPELFSTGQYAKEMSDVYSIGVLMWMLAAKRIPQVRRFPPVEVTDDGLRNIVKAVVIPDPAKRPTLAALQVLLQ